VPGTHVDTVFGEYGKMVLGTDHGPKYENWVSQWTKEFYSLETDIETVDKNGRWHLLKRYKTFDGGTLIIRSDISE